VFKLRETNRTATSNAERKGYELVSDAGLLGTLYMTDAEAKALREALEAAVEKG